MARPIPRQCELFIKEGEAYAKALPDGSCRSYQDQEGNWTIGWGSTGPDIGPNTIWTRAKAEERFKRDVAFFGRAAERLTSAKLNDDQFSALVSFLYNIGDSALNNTTTGRLFREGKINEAFLRFPLWNKITINGQKVVSSGLTKRRKDELALSRGNWKPQGGTA